MGAETTVLKFNIQWCGVAVLAHSMVFEYWLLYFFLFLESKNLDKRWFEEDSVWRSGPCCGGRGLQWLQNFHPGKMISLAFSRRGHSWWERSEIWILGKVTQLLPSGNGESGMGREAQSSTEPGRGDVNKGNFCKWKEKNYGRFWEFFLQVSWEVFTHIMSCSQTLTTALRQSRL